MSSTLYPPISFLANPRTLGQAMPLNPIVAMIPDGQIIYFVEVETDYSGRNARLSNHLGSATQMEFIVNQTAFENKTLLTILTKALLGGYFNPASIGGVGVPYKSYPYQHPYFSGMYAKDIIECVPFQPENSSPGQVWGNYNLCKITVSFESLNYPVSAPSSINDDYNPNWIEWKWEASSNRISIPLLWYKFTTGGFIGTPSSYGAWIVAPYANISATIYMCSHSNVMGIAAGPLALQPFVAQFLGQVNSAPFGGCPVQTLLFDSMEINRYTDWLGQRLYNVRLNFIFNYYGWNTAPDPSGAWNKVVFAVGGALPFPTTSIKAIVQSLNPF